jgi:rubrerythrin
MKRLALVAVSLILSGSFLSAAETTAPMTGQPAAKKEMKKAAKKPMKKAEAAPGAMEKKVVYKCAHCNQTADKPGKCPMCGMDMKKS